MQYLQDLEGGRMLIDPAVKGINLLLLCSPNTCVDTDYAMLVSVVAVVPLDSTGYSLVAGSISGS